MTMLSRPGLIGIARNQAVYNPETYVAASLLSTLTTLGLTANLKLCLDAGAGASYTSGQSWLDLSGNGYDFFRGATVGAAADDPTFNGVADAMSSAEYWSFDGGDYFRYDTTNETFMEAWHKDSAVFSIVMWVYPAGAGTNRLFGATRSVATNIGIELFLTSNTGTATFRVGNGTGSFAVAVAPNVGFADGAWQMIGCSVNEAPGTGRIARNATSTEITTTYTSPSAAAASYVYEIGCTGDAASRLPSGARIAMVAIFDTDLTAWQLEQIYNKTRRRFGV